MEVLKSKCYINPYTRFLVNGEDAIVTHVGNGRWLKMKKEILTFLKDNINQGSSIQEIIDQGSDEHSKKYISDLLKKLVKNGMFELDEKFMVRNKSKIEEIYINLTNRCNLRCIHCSVCAGEAIKGELSKEEIFKIIDCCCKLNPERILLTGGEIFVRKDIEDIIKYIGANFNGKLGLMTNGVLINDERVKLISKYVDDVNISLDGYNEKTADYIRGKGVFNKIIEVIEKLQNAGVKKISLSMVETKVTENHAQDFRDLCKKLNVKPIVRHFEPVGRGNLNYDKLKLSNNKDTENKPITAKQIAELKKNINGKCLCNAGTRVLSIDHIGDIYPCETLQQPKYKIGNFLKDGLNLNLDSPLQKLKNCIVDKIEGCKNCNVRYFCSSGCPNSDATTYYNEELRKIRCNEVKKFYESVIWGNN